MKVNISVIIAIINSLLFNHIDRSKIIFSSSFNVSYDYNAKYLFEYMKANYPQFKCRYVINDESKRKQLVNKYGDFFINTLTYKGAKDALTAGAWVTSAGLPVYIPFGRRKRLVMNVWHGMPLKKIVYDTKEINYAKKLIHRMFFSKGYSYISVTANKFKEYMSTAFEVSSERIVVMGQPRNDLLELDNDKLKICNDLGIKCIDKNTKLILYAPTFRDNNKTQYFPFNDFDKELLSKWLREENILLFIRPHKSEIASVKKYLNENIVLADSSKVEDIMSILNIFDCLITDYSSIAFDYLILERPMVFLPYDIDNYVKERGLYLNYEEFAVGPTPKSMMEFQEEIKRLLLDQDYYLEKRKMANNTFNEIRKDSCKLHSEFMINNI